MRVDLVRTRDAAGAAFATMRQHLHATHPEGVPFSPNDTIAAAAILAIVVAEAADLSLDEFFGVARALSDQRDARRRQ